VPFICSVVGLDKKTRNASKPVSGTVAFWGVLSLPLSMHQNVGTLGVTDIDQT